MIRMHIVHESMIPINIANVSQDIMEMHSLMANYASVRPFRMYNSLMTTALSRPDI